MRIKKKYQKNSGYPFLIAIRERAEVENYESRQQSTQEAQDEIKTYLKWIYYKFPEPIHDVIVLREIKEICKKIPSMDVMIEKKFTKAAMEVRQMKHKSQMVVIHTARRTLATLLADHGLPYHQVMKITGHKKIRRFRNT